MIPNTLVCKKYLKPHFLVYETCAFTAVSKLGDNIEQGITRIVKWPQ